MAKSRGVGLAVIVVLLGVGTSQLNGNCEVEFGGETIKYTSCQMLDGDVELYYQFVDDNVDITFAGESGGYIAVGFNEDRRAMIGTDCVIGYGEETGSGSYVGDYHLSSKTTSGVVEERNQGVLSDFAPEFRDGKMYVRFIRPQIVNGAASVTPGDVNMVWALGRLPVSPTLIPYHSRSRWAKKITLSDDGGKQIETPPISVPTPTSFGAIFVAHGALMIIAWGFLTPLATVLARLLYGKDPILFKVHPILQCISVTIAFAAWVMMLVKGSRTRTAHFIIGNLVMSLAILQIGVALFSRPKKDGDKRQMWELAHRVGGIAIVSLAITNCIIGIFILDSHVGVWLGLLIGSLGGMVAIAIYGFVRVRSVSFPHKIVATDDVEALTG